MTDNTNLLRPLFPITRQVFLSVQNRASHGQHGSIFHGDDRHSQYNGEFIINEKSSYEVAAFQYAYIHPVKERKIYMNTAILNGTILHKNAPITEDILLMNDVLGFVPHKILVKYFKSYGHNFNHFIYDVDSNNISQGYSEDSKIYKIPKKINVKPLKPKLKSKSKS